MTTLKKFLMVEPVSVTAAITGTLGILLFLGVNEDVIAALTVFIGGWLVVLRQMLTPNVNVELTKEQATLIRMGEENMNPDEDVDTEAWDALAENAEEAEKETDDG